jgi:hypothetical protein
MANNFIADVVIRARQRYHAYAKSVADRMVQAGETGEAHIPVWSEFRIEDQDTLLAEFGDIFGSYGLS